MQLDNTTFFIAAGVAFVLGSLILARRSGYLGGANVKKSIMVLQPRDKRFFDLNILKETETSLEAKKEGKPHRYFKSGPGWSGSKGSTRFIGIEGNAYTAVIVDDKTVTMRLPQAIKILFGDAYKKIPDPQRLILENHVFGVTVKPEEIPKEDKDRKLSAEDVNTENLKIAADSIGKRLAKKGKFDWIPYLTGFAFGCLIIWVAANLKWIPVAR